MKKSDQTSNISYVEITVSVLLPNSQLAVSASESRGVTENLTLLTYETK
jgi:hypothetical protein